MVNHSRLLCYGPRLHSILRSTLDTVPAPDHLCGDTTMQHVLEAGTAMRAHDDEISHTLVRHA